MRPEWYGDNKDLVKWTVILRTAVESSISNILWVAYYSESTYRQIKIDNQSYELPQELKDVFKNPTTLTKITTFDNWEIKIQPVFDRFNNKDRLGYHNKIIAIIERANQPYILFLDPDTGIQPKKPDGRHITNNEIETLWDKISTGSVMIIYQHRPQRAKGKEWIITKKEQLAGILGLDRKHISIGESEIAKDVILFIVKKHD